MEPKPGSDEAPKDPGVLGTHHSYNDQDFDGESMIIESNRLRVFFQSRLFVSISGLVSEGCEG